MATLAFTLFLALVFIGLSPFMPPAAVSAYGGVATSGDSLRQITYVLAFGMIIVASAQQYGLAMVRTVPVSIALLLGWCLASALWSDYSGVVIRRAGLEIIIVLSVFLGVGALGAQRAFAIWKWMLLAILVVNWLSIPVIPAARHFTTELDTALIGNWRGLYGHKNITGAVCVVTALMFLFTRNGKGNWFGILAAAAATGFLLMAHSKSSLGFLPLAAATGMAYRLSWKDGLSRAILTLVAVLMLFALGLATLFYADALNRLLSDPTEFTGRSAIWGAELAYIADHPLLGSGFGAFADNGGASPLAPYATGFDTEWVRTVSHGHNGYLQLLVTIGGIGFALAMASLVLSPALRFWKLSAAGLKPLLFALFVFTLLHNVMESDFLEGDGVSWTTMLLVIALLRNMDETGSDGVTPARAI
jgi:exopolysaccharide production protein ExoQ